MTDDTKACVLAIILGTPLLWLALALLPQKPSPPERPDEACLYPYAQQTMDGGIVWTWKRNWVCEEQGGWIPKRLASP